MRNKIIVIVFSLLGLYQQVECSFLKSIADVLGRTRPVFHLSRYYSRFSFHKIAQDEIKDNKNVVKRAGIKIKLDDDGNIQAIHDGKKSIIMLGSIPMKQKHIDLLELSIDSDKDDFIGMFTLNEPWEYQTSGLSHLVHINQNIKQYHYATPDFTPPTFIDLLRAVRDLDERDKQGLKGVYVHCKAGVGRSATTLAAYIAYLMHKTGVAISIGQIEAYLQSRRSVVHLNKKQKAAVEHFYIELQAAGSLDALYKKYQQEAEKRDRGVVKNFKNKI